MSQDPDDPSASTSSPNFETIFANALKQYKKRTKKDITAHSLAAKIESCDSPNAVLTVLQTQVQTFDPSPSAEERWTRLLNPTITVLYAFSRFVGNIAGPVFPPAAAIFTGIGVLLQVVRDVCATEDVLIDLFDRMKFFFLRLEKYIAVRQTVAMTEIIVKIMVEVISILGIATKEIGQGRFNKHETLKKLFRIHRVEDAFLRLDKFTQEGARMAEAEILTIAARIDEGIQAVSEHVSDLNRNLSRKALRQWIDPPDRTSNFYAAFDTHHEGTAAWCIEGKTFADWMASGSLLWIHGKPGSGKTVLSSVIIRNIESTAGLTFLAYFYFDYKDEGKKDSRALLSSLLDQLSNQSDQLCDVLRGLYLEHEDGSKQPHNDALLRCLKDMLTIARSVPIYLVMDALDECPNDSGDRPSWSPLGKVLSLVKELIGLRLPNLRLCITSRPELDIRTFIKPLATQEISLHDERGQRQDINTYVTFVVQSVKHWRRNDKNMVIRELEYADGMFRWVYCKLEVLRQCHRNDLRRILAEFPQSLDETYQRILKEINDANQKQTHRLLKCLVAARRPLRVEELAEVLALDIDAGGIPRFNAKWRWEDHEAAVLSTCSSLVSVVDYYGSRIVQFCHFSVKKFLMSDRLSSTEGISQFHIAHEASHVVLAQACLGALLSVDDPTSEDSAGDIPFAEYASENWLKHARVGNVELQIKEALDRLFDLDKPRFTARYRLDSSLEESKGVLSAAEPFYFAAASGLSGLAERLIVANKPQVIHFCDDKGTLLHLAVRGGHSEAVRLLLAHGADINSRKDHATPPQIASLVKRDPPGLGGHSERLLDSGLDEIDDVSSEESNDAEGFTPLLLAVSQKYFDLELCRILLEHEADVSVHDNSGNTPLHFAASKGYLDVARMLLELKANVNSLNEEGLTPLQRASQAPQERKSDIMQLLLDYGANVNVYDKSRNTPLHFAASEGHLEVARVLLGLKAEADSRNDEGLTPLQRALQDLQEGYRDMTRLLLDHGANLNTHDNNGDTPLHFAALYGLLERARMLIELKADVNSLNGNGSTPLHQASQCWGGSLDTVQLVRLLLDNGADLRARDKSGNTSLHFAASKGHLDVARLLLELKADVNSLDNDGSTPLHQALRDHWGRMPDFVQLVRLLLDNGADLHVRDKSGNTALHFAASKYHIEVARMLLELKADVNSLNDKGSTPLHQTLCWWQGEPDNAQLVRLLLDNGADIHTRDNSGNTALHFAASKCHVEVARMLLELQADVNSLDEEGLTPLQRVSQEKWNLGIMRLLLDYGADVNVYDKSRNTPLHFAASEGHLEVTRMLLELKAETDSLDDEGLTPLQRALQGMQEGYLDVMRLLLDHGANLNTHDNNGDTPLHFAARRGLLEVARMLIELKADVNSLNGNGSTPLHQASQCWRGSPDIVQLVRLLLDNGADLHARDKRGYTALHSAAALHHLEVVRMLLELKADINSMDDKGSTPLHQASHCWNAAGPDLAQLVRLLLDNGADPHVRDKDGDTALHLVVSERNLEVVCMLLELKADVNSLNDRGSTPLHIAFQAYWRGGKDLVQLVRLLLDNGADLHARDKSGKTALHLAAAERNLEVVRMLLELNADVNSRDSNGRTPLLIASERRSPDLVQLLFLDHNADVHVYDYDGCTPLHYAAIAGWIEICRLLLKLDAKVNSRNNGGSTPLHLASAGDREGHPVIVRLLLEHGAHAQALNFSGQTASEVARGRTRRKIVRLLSQHAAE